MENITTKSPTEMIEALSAEIIESIALLELIYNNSNEHHETDCTIACLIRSLDKTKEKQIYLLVN